MANAKQNIIEQYLDIKNALIAELADVSIAMDESTLIYNETMADLQVRKDKIEAALFGGVENMTPPTPAKKTPTKRRTVKKTAAKRRATKKTAPVPNVRNETESNVERVLTAIHASSGASRQDLRGLLPDLTENQLKAALGTCAKKGFIQNRGSKVHSAWYAV